MTDQNTPPVPPPPGGGGGSTSPSAPQGSPQSPSSPVQEAQPKKKGLPTLAWVAIGCGGVLLLGAIAVVVAIGMGLNWVGGQVQDFEDNPEMAGAVLFVRANPELELVERNDEDGTLTVRNKRTGEVVTANVGEIREGNLSFTDAEGNETSFGVEQNEEGQVEFRATGPDGDSSVRLGGGSAEDLPEWVPVYPGATVAGSMISTSGGQVEGYTGLQLEATADEVAAWYEAELTAAGWVVETQNEASYGGTTRQVTRTFRPEDEADERRIVVVVLQNEEGTGANLTFSGPAG